MSARTPGQKAYEAVCKAGGWIRVGGEPPAWSDLGLSFQEEWEQIAAAVTAPEPKSYGRVLADALNSSTEFHWNIIETVHASEMERAAQAVISEARKRGDL